MSEQNVYTYSGPVYHYEHLIAHHFEAETTAPTLRKAKSNIAWQYRKQYGYAASYQIELPGIFQRIL